MVRPSPFALRSQQITRHEASSQLPPAIFIETPSECGTPSNQGAKHGRPKPDLGHGLAMPEPEADGGELEHGKEVGGMLFITRCDTAAMLYTVEEPLDAISFSVEHGAETGALAAGDFGWNTRRGTSRLNAMAVPIGIVGFVHSVPVSDRLFCRGQKNQANPEICSTSGRVKAIR